MLVPILYQNTFIFFADIPVIETVLPDKFPLATCVQVPPNGEALLATDELIAEIVGTAAATALAIVADEGAATADAMVAADGAATAAAIVAALGAATAVAISALVGPTPGFRLVVAIMQSRFRRH